MNGILAWGRRVLVHRFPFAVLYAEHDDGLFIKASLASFATSLSRTSRNQIVGRAMPDMVGVAHPTGGVFTLMLASLFI